MTERGAAIIALLEKPDPRELPPRGHNWTSEGSPVRHITMLDLPQRFTQLRRHDTHDISEVIEP